MHRYLLCTLVAAAVLAWVPQAIAHQGAIAEEALLESEILEEAEGHTTAPDSEDTDSDTDDCGCPSPADATSQFERTQACFCVHVLCNALLIDELRSIWEPSEDPDVHQLLLTGFTMNGVPIGSTDFWLAMHEADMCAGSFVGDIDPDGETGDDGGGPEGEGTPTEDIPIQEKDPTQLSDDEWADLEEVLWDYLSLEMMDPELGLPLDVYAEDAARFLASLGYSDEVILLMLGIVEHVVVCVQDGNCNEPLPPPDEN